MLEEALRQEAGQPRRPITRCTNFTEHLSRHTIGKPENPGGPNLNLHESCMMRKPLTRRPLEINNIQDILGDRSLQETLSSHISCKPSNQSVSMACLDSGHAGQFVQGPQHINQMKNQSTNDIEKQTNNIGLSFLIAQPYPSQKLHFLSWPDACEEPQPGRCQWGE